MLLYIQYQLRQAAIYSAAVRVLYNITSYYMLSIIIIIIIIITINYLVLTQIQFGPDAVQCSVLYSIAEHIVYLTMRYAI